jgi:hypothetical protein
MQFGFYLIPVKFIAAIKFKETERTDRDRPGTR